MTALSRPATARQATTPALCPDLAVALALSLMRHKYGPRGWRVFISDKGRWWATRGSSEAWTIRQGFTGLNRPAAEVMPDAVDADDASGLAAKLERRTP